MLTYVHPLTAAAVLLLLAYVASLGIRARNDPRRSAGLLRDHRRLAPWAYALILASWIFGVTTTWALRPELEVAESQHFRVGLALVAVLSASALSSRWMRHAAVRAIHPWFGVLGMLLAVAQIFFGLQITP